MAQSRRKSLCKHIYPGPGMRVGVIASVLVLPVISASAAPQDGPAASARTFAELDRQFKATVHPFVRTYCVTCHGAEKPKGDLDLSPFATVESVAKDHLRWELVLGRLRDGDMPPEKAKVHPKPEQRQEIIDWLVAVRDYEAKRNAGDPGIVLARRLSNSEYDYTIRDLTGVDIRPAREFPIDPANEAGFDNSGESLTMSPALLKKYIEAARRVADHVVLKPEGFAFAAHPAVADTDRDKYCVNEIIAFYKRQRTDYADYFEAAWRFRHRGALVRANATLAEVAVEQGMSAKYFGTVWAALEEGQEELGPIAALRAMWHELPGANADAGDVRAGCEKMRDFVVALRGKLVPTVRNLTSPGVHNGSQTMVMWKNRQFAANRRRYAGGALQLTETFASEETAAAKLMAVPAEASAQASYEAAFGRFCSVFPDAFFVSERARVYLDPEKEKALKGRLLSAGFHSQGGFFRDDGPLYELMLDEAQQRELDRLWQELDFVTGAPMRQHTGFIWFERTDSRYLRDPEFDVFRAEDKDSTSEEKIRKLAEIYMAKTRRMGASETALKAIEEHFESINASIRWVEQAKVAAEPSHVEALKRFAERAYRRPLSQAERDGVAGFYRVLRQQDGLSHEDAVRDTIVAVLMSPNFCYRVDLPGTGQGERRALSDVALASRLSYFLWASMPDQQLLERAKAGELHKPEVIAAEARRMLRDPRVRGMASEFVGNWLDFRRFQSHSAVDRERFPSFDNDLREAMFEEPLRFFIDVASEDRSILDFLYGRHTFVNASLARHYGMAEPDGSQWVRVDDAAALGRGGLLPMSVFLTKNAPGLRTSPVKRGYWVARRLLGEHIPPPPAEVPELPSDETKLGELTLSQALARHRADKACASCHDRFDSLGLVFEGYGPIGELRDKDLGGRPVETRAAFPNNGGEGAGLEGLKAYIKRHRESDFVDNLCRKLLANALGRTLLLSDEETIQQMRRKLAENDHRFGAIIETIVTSPQFLHKRGDVQLAQEGAP